VWEVNQDEPGQTGDRDGETAFDDEDPSPTFVRGITRDLYEAVGEDVAECIQPDGRDIEEPKPALDLVTGIYRGLAKRKKRTHAGS
jgi:hypothetical protein